ncbi:peptidase inhibitor family I36 protein [Pleurocapsa sp. PCC 7319]|uniref:peptidase inhibitor family I36 protein n=1 Tax=Pleurocapsa sp. PCC 7319 TaxID=118161 RepID=UPI000348513B|nr:peptidase inhibitor family I36 protein [Pleurocapsa sp. PCC 7319]
MSKINHQSLSLSSIELFQDITPETAATISGGIVVTTGANFAGQAKFDGSQNLSVSDQQDGVLFNDQISAVYNDTDVRWAFYTGADYTGERFTLEPGEFIQDLLPTGFNDEITSYRSEADGLAQPIV